MGVFAEPEQLVLNVTQHDRFIVIASDGVFEFITSQKVRMRGAAETLRAVMFTRKASDVQRKSDGIRIASSPGDFVQSVALAKGLCLEYSKQ